jgi:hypothetical protein
MKTMKWFMNLLVVFAAGSVSLAQSVNLQVNPVQASYTPGTVVTIKMVANSPVAALEIFQIISSHGGTAQSPSLNSLLSEFSDSGTIVNSGDPYILIENIVGYCPMVGGMYTYVPAGETLHSFSFVVPNVPDGTSITIRGSGVTFLFEGGATSSSLGSANLLVENVVTCTVPNVVGQTESSARSIIEAADLIVGSISSQCSNTVPAGRVISQNPTAGTSVSCGSNVNLTISTGPCPPTTQACCFSDGQCEDLTALECTISGGTPQGEGTTCSTTTCPKRTQACCFSDGSCQDLDPSVCSASGGSPQGEGTTCSTTACGGTQACCFENETCEDLTPSVCSARGGSPQGLGSTCASADCSREQACCSPSGNCYMKTESQCLSIGWTPSGPMCLGDNDGNGRDDACDNVPLPGQTGACCTPWWDCYEIDENTCLDNHWTWLGTGTQCKGDLNGDGRDDTCYDGGGFGACCDPRSGQCSIVTEQQCEAQGGVWRGANTQCVGDADHDGWDDACGPEPGACCNPWGNCFILRQVECLDNGWTWYGPGSQCIGDLNQDGSDDTCQKLGACCEPSSGQCFEQISQIDCLGLGGIWHGPGTVCMGDANHDGVDDSCPGVGMCCDGLGNCYVLTQAKCNEQPGWTWGGPGTQCLGDIDGNGMDEACEGTGACCDPVSGACRILKENECINRKWIWHGRGTRCLGDKNRDGKDDTCTSLGACCDPSGLCWSLTEAICKMQGSGWVWHGVGTKCLGDSDGNGQDDACGLPQACCFGDGSCEDILAVDCVALGGIPQGSGIQCRDNPCVKTGACCDPESGECQNLTEHECIDKGWKWQGADTRCLGDRDGDNVDDACGGPGKNKWSQPPVGITGTLETPPFNGWDELSWYGASGLVADDWLCTDNRPVAGIRWWGSFVGWNNSELPSVKPRAFHIGIWTDVPKGSQFSHPGEMVWEYWCHDWELEFVGYNKATGKTEDACFVFTVKLPAVNVFRQQGQGASGTKYWLSIAGEYNPDGPKPEYVWGWTTRPDVQNDGAVMIGYPINPVIGDAWQGGKQICNPDCLKTNGMPWDVAFELMSN